MNPSGNPLGYLAAFTGGILVSFTPCVYPLIPVVLGVIGARGAGSRSRGLALSLSYSLGIALTYSLLGVLVVLTGRLFGSIASYPLSYILLGGICIFFGLYMLEVFDLPFARVSSGQDIRDKGIFSIFLLGVASGLVVGPCTTPVLGTILAYAAASGNLFYGATLLFVFALGMCSILILVGTFGGLILPKAGRFSVYIKKICAMILILAGGYFLIIAGRLLWLRG